MTIRNEAERAAAQARLDETVAIGRSRNLTDDEQRDVDHLAGDLADYKARTATGRTTPTASAGHGKATMPALLGQGAAPAPAPSPPGSVAVDPAANMRRQAAALGWGPPVSPPPPATVGASTSQANMQRELRRAGLLR